MYNFDHKFPLKAGVMVFVQDDKSRAEGDALCNWIDGRWTAPSHFFHFRPGGHVAAARVHESAGLILGLDLRRFYDQVTRSKIHRALKRIGFKSSDAYDFACEGTVMKDGKPGQFSLPYGFVQSMHLASLVLHYSALGRAMKAIRKGPVALSVYVDDVLLSCDDREQLLAARAQLFEGAETAGFEFNATKERGPSDRIDVFNLRVGGGELRVLDHRLNEFRQTVLQPPEEPALGTIGYVRTVNAAQADALAAVRKAAGF